tara:strand:- start:1082 stop:1732 length:651 start_codon:yes stop_codon:yes gene_type:complete
MNSKRLPGKSMMNIDGKPLIGHVIDNIKMIKEIKSICLATSTISDDDIIENYCINNNIKVFRGKLNNVFDRFQKITQICKENKIIRISGDSPLINPMLIKQIISFSKNKNFDICTNLFPRTFPKGQSVEIINANTLLKINQKLLSNKEKENVTSFFYNNSRKFKIINFSNDVNLNNINFSVDTNSDFIKIRKLMTIIKNYKKKISLKKLIEMYENQ